MSLTAKGTETTYEPLPSGTHVARCVQVIDLGQQYSDYYAKWSHKVLIGWELPEIVKEGSDEPGMIWKRYTISLHQKSNLRMDLESWRSRSFTPDEMQGFDLRTIIGVPCLISITHNPGSEGQTYANVSAVMALPKGTQVAPQYHDKVVFDVENWDQSVFDTFSDNLKDTIKSCKELKDQDDRERTAQDQSREEDPAPSFGDDDDIPF